MVVIANHIEGYFNDCRGKLVSVFRGFFSLQIGWQKTPTNPKEEACSCPIKLHNWIYACIGSNLAVLFLYQSGQRYVDLSNQVTQLHPCTHWLQVGGFMDKDECTQQHRCAHWLQVGDFISASIGTKMRGFGDFRNSHQS